MQIQQKMAAKMQAHMMKSGPPMHMQPSQDQQRAIQLQMLGHMKK
jgi:site-specific recombinase XerC